MSATAPQQPTISLLLVLQFAPPTTLPPTPALPRPSRPNTTLILTIPTNILSTITITSFTARMHALVRRNRFNITRRLGTAITIHGDETFTLEVRWEGGSRIPDTSIRSDEDLRDVLGMMGGRGWKDWMSGFMVQAMSSMGTVRNAKEVGGEDDGDAEKHEDKDRDRKMGKGQEEEGRHSPELVLSSSDHSASMDLDEDEDGENGNKERSLEGKKIGRHGKVERGEKKRKHGKSEAEKIEKIERNLKRKRGDDKPRTSKQRAR